jgi:hypothetical protein
VRNATKTTLKTLGTALCAGLGALTAIPSASEAEWRYGRDRYGHVDREWVGHRKHRHSHHYHERGPRYVVERPVYVMPQPMYMQPQDQGINLNFTIPLR